MNVHDWLPRQLPHVNSPASPFGVVTVFSTGGGFSLFNCSTSANNGSDSRNGWSIPCLSTPDFQVRYLDSGFGISDFPLSSCAKMYSISHVPSAVFTGQEQYNQTYNYVLLNWSKPSCANCEANGKHCRLKINGANNETECVDIPRQPGDGTYLRHTFPYVVIQIKIRIRHQFRQNQVVLHIIVQYEMKALVLLGRHCHKQNCLTNILGIMLQVHPTKERLQQVWLLYSQFSFCCVSF